MKNLINSLTISLPLSLFSIYITTLSSAGADLGGLVNLGISSDVSASGKLVESNLGSSSEVSSVASSLEGLGDDLVGGLGGGVGSLLVLIDR